MKFLIDTNIIIKAEPTSIGEMELDIDDVAQLLGMVATTENQTYIHPSSLNEIERDRDTQRRDARLSLLKKYPRLPTGPVVSASLRGLLPKQRLSPHDQVDLQLLAALERESVDYLITEDLRLIKRGRRAGLGARIATVVEAREILESLFGKTPQPLPLVKHLMAYDLDERDPIWSSFRSEYRGFNDWLRKCKREHRHAWVIDDMVSKEYSGVCIVKDENPAEINIPGRILKICSFKVSNQHRGNRYGELLLRTFFDYCYHNSFESTYITVFPKYVFLIRLLEDFGFRHLGTKSDTGEAILGKSWIIEPTDKTALTPIEYNIRYGPNTILSDNVPIYIIPIRPNYHEMLFPDASPQLACVPWNRPFSNSMKKAYLSHSPNRSLSPGSILLFYRSHDLKSITSVGVTEELLVSDNPDNIARLVGKRTVYSYEEICSMCSKQVLAILFRYAYTLSNRISLAEIKAKRVLNGTPQSITKVSQETTEWLKTRIKK